jgi:hypothetical protein
VSQDGDWRTDIFKSTLSDQRLRFAKFILKDGPTVIIPAEELRRILEGGSDRISPSGCDIWGPFNINVDRRTVNGHVVRMEVEK